LSGFQINKFSRLPEVLTHTLMLQGTSILAVELLIYVSASA